MRPSETDNDTICALATAPGAGAISVIRVSGPRATEITRKLASFLPSELESHRIYYGILKSVKGDDLDEVLVSYFREGRSFTGEFVFEISCHGSQSVVNDILSELIKGGARAARRGEFTFRAFMNGRLDLVQAEGILDLVQSRSSRATRLALRQLKGDVSDELVDIRDQLTWVLANLEANIDFAAEDIEIASPEALLARVRTALVGVERLLGSYSSGRLLTHGFEILLLGRPNAGKSSLLNALVGEDKAIVTAIPGTTRDFVEGELVVNGIRVKFIDSAGLRESNDEVERIGIERALSRISEVDQVWYIYDVTQGLDQHDHVFLEHVPWDKTVMIANKVDLAHHSIADNESKIPRAKFELSLKSGQGFEELREYLSTNLSSESADDSAVITNARHFDGLNIVRGAMVRGIAQLEESASPDLIALELQMGLKALYELLGMSYDDEVMDRVFKEFCLGK